MTRSQGPGDGSVAVFAAVVEPMAWGRSTYTVLRVPDSLVDAARAAGTRRVAGTVDEVEVNLALTRNDVIDDHYLYAGASLLRRLGVRPGDVVDCVLAPVDPDEVAVPGEVVAALEGAGLSDRWEALAPPTRRRLLQPVQSARRESTRADRVAVLLDRVRDGGAP